MSKLSREIEAVRVAESQLEARRENLERRTRNLAKRTRRLLMPYGLLAGGLVAGVMAERWLSPGPQRESGDGSDADNGDSGNAEQRRTSFIAEIGSLLAIANSLTPLAMNFMDLHQRWQAGRHQDPTDARPDPEATYNGAATNHTDAPRGASA